MKYGYFDDEHREYVLTNPKTPAKWINYVGTLAFGGLVDHTGGVLICKGDPALNRITKYLPQLPASEFKGSTLYLRLRRDELGVLLMCTMLGNTSYIGYPMIEALLGAQALPYAVVYDQFGTFVMLSTLGLVLLARYGGDEPPTARAIALRIVRFPPVWALVFGLTLMPEQPPAWIADALGQLAGVMLMLVMLAVGMTIQLRLPRDELGPLALGLSLKLVLLPALALGLALGFGLQGDMRQVAVLESAMPTMVTAAALAISHGLAPRLAAALVGYGIVLAMATLPAWRFVLDRLGS